VFDAESHRFLVNLPLSEAAVEAFEREHRVSLPSDYRRFLTEIGNGGAGPFYGVFPLGVMDDNFGLRTWSENDGTVGVLSEPFPYEKEWNDLSGQPNDALLETDEAEYNRRLELFSDSYWCSSHVNGAIPICHEGCALRVWLVLNGSQAGCLWRDLRSEFAGLKPIQTADGSPATFASWYGEWLGNVSAPKQR